MQNPLVSVIITTYNREKFLNKAIESVFNQTYKNIEILVVDDGSINKYAEPICKQFSNCTYWYKANGGISSARNFGIAKAKGEFIAFLDDDDFWEPLKTEKQIKILLENKDIDCVHASAAVVDEENNPTGEIIGASINKAHKRSGYVFWNALGVWVVKSPTPLIRKTVFKPDLRFDETIKVGEDIDFYQRMFYRHKVYYIQEPLAFYREYSNEKRLSKQLEKYIGIEHKIYNNFKKMGIVNPLTRHRIKMRLAKSVALKWKEFYGYSEFKISFFNLFFKPLSVINKYSKCD